METRKLLYLDFGNERNADDSQVTHVITQAIRSSRWKVFIATNAQSAYCLLNEHHPGVGLALLMPKSNDDLQEFVHDSLQRSESIQWLALLAGESVLDPEIRLMISDCFYDYHTLPPDVSRLLNSLGHAHGMQKLKSQILFPQQEPEQESEMVGVDKTMCSVFRNIRKIANVDASVLICGESGTGKELAACAIHERSHRSAGPFVAINCAALPSSIIQSELFGHERGAFTGAQRSKMGYIESAAGGTLFLDEIGDLPADLQINLLRFLQEGIIQRVGSTVERFVDARVITATHVDLEKAVAEGRFREDLYFRINVLHLDIPPLRERRQDVEVLARFFYQKFNGEKGCKVKGFSDQAIRSMANYSWPGNVRELINCVRRAMVMCDKPLIGISDLGLVNPTATPPLKTLEQARGEAEKTVLQSALKYSGRNLSQAARGLKISRPALYRLMDKYGFER